MITIIIQNIYIKVTNKKYLLSFFGCNFKDLTKIVIFKIKNFYIWMFKTTINDSITLFRLNYFNKYRFYLVSFINVNIKKRFIKFVTINVKKCAPGWIFSRGKFNGLLFQVNFSSKRGLLQLCQLLYLCTWVDGQDHQNFCLKNLQYNWIMLETCLEVLIW